MPYIKPENRKDLEPCIEWILDLLLSEGDLNYVITRIMHTFIADHGSNYAAYNAAIGVLECAKLELYRRQVAPYEDKKIKENGDV